uniref:Uncharacterized protein n=1 Tax=Aegilops tauschii subsp. strangulata TaxID=200361 RepID=A0A453SVA0_AEGTS
GPETDMYVLCHGHGKAAERRVAFEGIHTGRRFLCCAEKNSAMLAYFRTEYSWVSTHQHCLVWIWQY